MPGSPVHALCRGSIDIIFLEEVFVRFVALIRPVVVVTLDVPIPPGIFAELVI